MRETDCKITNKFPHTQNFLYFYVLINIKLLAIIYILAIYNIWFLSNLLTSLLKGVTDIGTAFEANSFLFRCFSVPWSRKTWTLLISYHSSCSSRLHYLAYQYVVSLHINIATWPIPVCQPCQCGVKKSPYEAKSKKQKRIFQPYCSALGTTISTNNSFSFGHKTIYAPSFHNVTCSNSHPLPQGSPCILCVTVFQPLFLKYG